MNKQIFNKINMEYEKRQKESLYNYLDSKKALYSKIPEIEEIDFKIKKTGINLNRFIILGMEDKKVELLDQIHSLKYKKNLILKSSNYPLEALQRKFVCTACNDTGFINIGNRTKKCSCYEQLIISYLYEQSNLNLTEIENFDSFDESLYSDSIITNDKSIKKCTPRENILSVRDSVKKFISNFDNPSDKNLFFTGATGVGKTFMCSCVAFELLNMGRTVLYQSAPSLFDILNDYKFKNFKDNTYKNSKFNDIMYSNIFNVELLIIDDLGTEFKSASRYSDLLNVLNTRSSNNTDTKIKKTVISTNLNTKQLYDYYDERTASRVIGDYNIYKFFGDDLRKMKRLRNSLSQNELRTS